MKSPLRHDVGTDVPAVIKSLRGVVLEAVSATCDAVRKCLSAGQALNEARCTFNQRRGLGGAFAAWDDGDGWGEFVAKNLPEISDRTAERWMRAAANVFRAVGNGQEQMADGKTIDVEAIPVSELLATPDDELPVASREWKQAWLDFTANKTIKDCLAGVFVDGDEAVRADRAINGATARQTSGADRKNYPAFIGKKLKQMTEHLVVKGTRNTPPHAREIDADQRAKIASAFDGAMIVWPRWLLELLKSAAARELKLSEVERAMRLKEAMPRNFTGKR